MLMLLKCRWQGEIVGEVLVNWRCRQPQVRSRRGCCVVIICKGVSDSESRCGEKCGFAGVLCWHDVCYYSGVNEWCYGVKTEKEVAWLRQRL